MYKLFCLKCTTDINFSITTITPLQKKKKLSKLCVTCTSSKHEQQSMCADSQKLCKVAFIWSDRWRMEEF